MRKPTIPTESKLHTSKPGFSGIGLARLRSREAMLFGVALVLFSFMLLFPMRSQSLLAALERFSFDAQMRLLREYFPRPALVEPVLIGIDDAALAQYPEPLALWHKHYAKVYEALARAKPKVVGIDVVLPEKSFDYLQPGSDFALLKGLVALQAVAPVVYASTIDRDGKTLPIHSTFIRVIGEERDDRFGVDQFFIDPDQVARRFDESAMGANVHTLAGQMTRAMGYSVGAGFVDFSVGEPIQYVPMQRVITWLQDDNEAALK
ncbi:MAG: CHASE2 domain-containing protein, partial [Betaproteobacteria bacterium]|nr:CHASE2 domain-containing protein [Betaproteobacteria bacterium]